MSEFDYGKKLPNGQFERHPSLEDGQFVRPVRNSYKHVGIRPKYPTRHLTDEEVNIHSGLGYVVFEMYPESESPLTGRFWTEEQLRSGCGSITIMAKNLAETYARNPSFYGKTFCVHCHDYFPVGKSGEFIWIEDNNVEGPRVGT